MPAFGRWMQEDQELKLHKELRASLCYETPFKRKNKSLFLNIFISSIV